MKILTGSAADASHVKYFCGFLRALIWLFLAVIVVTIGSSPVHAQATEYKGIPYQDPISQRIKWIRVGVRKNAEPFSYLRSSRVDNEVLPSYSGYIVEICRTVLRQIVAGEVFHGYKVKAVPVKADDRFEKLSNREVDLLCGPDSITVERLRLYNVSYPVFLSGIARVKLPTELMPRSVYCKSILGLVAGTTSEQAGINAMVDAHLFGRFEPAIRQYMKLKAGDEDASYHTLEDQWANFKSNTGFGDKSLGSGGNQRNDSDVPPETIITKECPQGFTSGPVVPYDSHAKGLEDLCSGEILYYLGDIDIVKRYLPPGCEHLDLGQRTFTKEAYGVHFRKPPRTAYEDLDDDERRDAMLYSEFNYVLGLQMQSSERLLENQYREEFKEAEMAADLQRFFSSMQYATDY